MFRIVAHEDDGFAKLALGQLEKMGYEVHALRDGTFADTSDVAIFTVDGGNGLRFPSRHARMASHRLLEAGVVPEWASATPYTVALRQHPNGRTRESIKSTIQGIGEVYDRWFAGRTKCNCPWGCEPKGSSSDFFKKWTQKNLSVASGNEKAAQFFTYLEPLDNANLRKASARLQAGGARAVSALCFHSNEARTEMVSVLNEKIQRAAASLISDLPIEQMDIFTFHPDDMQVLEKYRLQSVVLKGFWDRKIFEQQWNLSQGFVNLCAKAVLRPINHLFRDDVLVKEVFCAARDRAGQMVKEIAKNPPPIFRLLNESEREDRLASEAVMYLLMTVQYSGCVYVGFEVHSEYWRSGELFQWNDKFLPVTMVPCSLRQHWGEWAVGGGRISEVMRLGLI